MNYVASIGERSIRVEASDEAVRASLKELGAVPHGESVEITFVTESDLARLLTALQAYGILFVDQPAGWPPAAVFAGLRDKGLVSGQIQAISWTSPGNPIIRNF